MLIIATHLSSVISKHLAMLLTFLVLLVFLAGLAAFLPVHAALHSLLPPTITCITLCGEDHTHMTTPTNM